VASLSAALRKRQAACVKKFKLFIFIYLPFSRTYILVSPPLPKNVFSAIHRYLLIINSFRRIFPPYCCIILPFLISISPNIFAFLFCILSLFLPFFHTLPPPAIGIVYIPIYRPPLFIIVRYLCNIPCVNGCSG
jgi:hypothetical protein